MNALIPLLQSREIDKTQLTRLHYCLQDNPVLLWGGVQSILLQAPDCDLSETELPALERISQRLLWLATDRKLGRRDLEFTLQNCSEVRPDGASIEVNTDLTAEQIRDFMTRAEQLVQSFDVPNEPYEKTPAEAFAILIDKALNPPAEPRSLTIANVHFAEHWRRIEHGISHSDQWPRLWQTFRYQTQETILGRHPDCHVIIEVGAVSRQHAKIHRVEDAYELQDLGSRNGTFLNGQLITAADQAARW